MAVAAYELESPPITYVSVDAFPWVAEGRRQVHDEAWTIIKSRERQVAQNDTVAVPLPVDALSTALKVIEARDQYGEHSEIYHERRAGLALDCLRLITEWRRKNKWEYFPQVRHQYDPETGDYYSHGLSIRQMTEDALTPIDEPEEVDRRVNERVEEATPRLLKSLGRVALGSDSRMRTISECTDAVIQKYQSGATTGFRGYVPEIEKLMIRDMLFDSSTGDRFEEQIGLSGIYITHDVITRALERRGISARHMGRTELHGTQLLAQDDLIDFVELLDTVASEEWCVDIFMGEKIEPGQPKDYAGVRAEAFARQEKLQSEAETVALFVMDLAEQPDTDRREAPALVEEFVKKILINMADQNHALATEIFDEKTAQGLREVAHLRAIGREDEAASRLLEVEAAAPGGGYCGAGSCGLEAVKSGSKEADAAAKLGSESPKDLIKDTERKCPSCREKTIVYDTKKKLKLCTNEKCGKTKSY